MSFNAIGDLASSLLLRQASSKAKQNLVRLSSELTTGLTFDVRGRLRNDLSRQLDWEHGISKNQVLEKTLTEALVKVQTKQIALNAISESSTSFSNDVSVALNANANTAVSVLSQKALVGLEQTLSHLNAQAMGKSLFAGNAHNGPAMASAGDLVASVKAFVGTNASVTGLVQGVRDWMEDPNNGYESVAYLGSSEAASPIRLANDRTIDEASRANSPALKTVVENYLLAALSADETLPLSQMQRTELLQVASDGIRSNSEHLIDLQASIGFVEAEVTKAKVTASSEIFAYERFRVETLGINEFETASKLQETELQLEKIYALTARSARMSLLEYLR